MIVLTHIVENVERNAWIGWFRELVSCGITQVWAQAPPDSFYHSRLFNNVCGHSVSLLRLCFTWIRAELDKIDWSPFWRLGNLNLITVFTAQSYHEIPVGTGVRISKERDKRPACFVCKWWLWEEWPGLDPQDVKSVNPLLLATHCQPQQPGQFATLTLSGATRALPV